MSAVKASSNGTGRLGRTLGYGASALAILAMTFTTGMSYGRDRVTTANATQLAVLETKVKTHDVALQEAIPRREVLAQLAAINARLERIERRLP